MPGQGRRDEAGSGVAGIGHYGNSIGVPTVGGEVYFEPPYEQNCLVNAMCIGFGKTDSMVRAAAAGVGNQVVLMGASTGRDGIGGASVLASAELDEADESKRPSVQIGDPFEESKLVECCLELLGEGLLVSLQDLGAAGLTSSAAEMTSAGSVGIDIDVGRVPLREADMEPFEIMVSESQERMFAVVEPAKVDEVLAICRKWQAAPAARFLFALVLRELSASSQDALICKGQGSSRQPATAGERDKETTQEEVQMSFSAIAPARMKSSDRSSRSGGGKCARKRGKRNRRRCRRSRSNSNSRS